MGLARHGEDEARKPLFALGFGNTCMINRHPFSVEEKHTNQGPVASGLDCLAKLEQDQVR